MPASPIAERSPSPPGNRVAALLIGLVIGLGALGAVLVVVPSALFDLDRFSVPKELVLIGTATVAGLVLLARAEAIELGFAELCLAGYLGLSALSTVLATNRWISTRAFAITLAGSALFFSARFAAARLGRGVVLWGLVAAVVAGTLTGLLQAYGWTWELLADTRAPGGTLGNRNFMAHLTVIGLPLGGWLAARARRRAGYLLALVAVGLMSAAIVLSRSRAAWVGVGAVVAVIGIIGVFTRSAAPRLGRRRAMGLALAMAIGAALALVLPNRLDWKSSSPYRDSLRDVLNYREGSGRGRLIQYRNTLELVRRDPMFGVGPGNWLVDYPLVTTRGDPSFDEKDPIPTNPWPSSDWIAMLAERGPLATLCWIGFLGSLAVVAIRRARDPDHGAAALAALGVLAAASVEGVFDAVLLLAPPTLIVMAAAGALLPATRPVSRLVLTGRRGRAVAGGLVLGFALTARSAGMLQAILVARDGWPVAEVEQALDYDPGNYRLHLLGAQRSPCPAARRHADRATALLPHHPWPARLQGRCR